MKNVKNRSLNMFLFIFVMSTIISGCGYKGDPVYVSDENSVVKESK